MTHPEWQDYDPDDEGATEEAFNEVNVQFRVLGYAILEAMEPILLPLVEIAAAYLYRRGMCPQRAPLHAFLDVLYMRRLYGFSRHPSTR